MIIKRYLVNNMKEALSKIRRELGKDALIISQRRIRKPGIKGYFSKKVLEVTAAVENIKRHEDIDLKSSVEAIKKMVKYEDTETILQRRIEPKGIVTEASVSTAVLENPKLTNSNELMKEMQEVKGLINSLINKVPDKTGNSKLENKLIESDINIKVLKKLFTKIKSMPGAEDEFTKAKMAIEKIVSITKVKMEGTVILVGPTGVGKTTTIAKLAGKLSLIEKKKVGLITIDTYRIGAVDQLKTYADIMNIPFRVVLNVKEMETALESMKGFDVILIDTTGRSSKNTFQISELQAFIDKVNLRSVHLVLSSTTKNKDIDNIIDGYRILNFDNIIITKLDETTTYGSILNILDYGKKPLSFVTTGQNVPDDIRNLTPLEVSNLIIGEDSV